MARISTSSSGGNVNIQDTSGNAINSTSGALDVNVVSGGVSGVPVAIYQASTGVAMGATSMVFSYTVPIDTILAINNISISSDSVSEWDVEINNVLNAKKRISYLQWNEAFQYGGYQLQSGDSIKVFGINNSTQGVAEFNVTLIGVTS